MPPIPEPLEAEDRGQQILPTISLPVLMQKEGVGQGKANTSRKTVEAVNSASALWTRNKSDITTEQYTEFLQKIISYDQDAPLAWSHNRVRRQHQYAVAGTSQPKAHKTIMEPDKKPASSCMSSACSSWTMPRR